MARLALYAPSRSDCEILIQVMRLYFWLGVALQETKITVARLRRLLFGKHLKPSPPPDGEEEAPNQPDEEETPPTPLLDTHSDAAQATASEGEPGDSETAQTSKAKGGHPPGTGRLGADAYEGAERVECHHEDLAAGQRCPACGQGNLYQLPPGRTIRIEGNALLSAIRYEIEKLRCSACGQVFTAPLPESAGEEKYCPRARAVLAISRTYLGLPFYRLEGYQAMLGVPVPDATQWDQIEKVGDCCYKVFEHLEGLAAQGELIYQDDTSVRILSLIKENQRFRAEAAAQGRSRSKERTGMFTTGLVVQVGERTIYLYYSGRSHAGENLKALLLQRQAGLAKPVVMSDALKSNEADEAGLIRCNCLAHGRRQFSDLIDIFPAECGVVIKTLKDVFDHDDEARDQQMSPAERLAYHQSLSAPLLEELQEWLQHQINDRLVEDNGSLGQAIRYLHTHWEKLTRFLSIEGAPLDNNLVERALKLFIRQRKNSLFYRTEHSAYIASVITSLIATCLHAGVNALDYLVALQEHRAEVVADPSAWLPWTYQASLVPP